MDLHVKFDGHEIIVTRPGTDMMTAYRKRPDSPNLALTRSWLDPTTTSPESASFEPKHFKQRSPRRASSGGLCEGYTPSRGIAALALKVAGTG